ncbi:MAG: gamma-glutamyltransferase family protein, partial [Acidobacteria bacterium]|nr:gamma-glutamyltransferase family protein [Acidobacteriota bacterium]
MHARRSTSLLAIALLLSLILPAQGQMRTAKPPLHGAHWMAVTGKPLAATAGAMTFQKGGNAIDAAAAMLAATCTMWDTLSWGGETQALIYNPHTKKVIGIDALGVAPTGATPEFFHGKNMKVPPEYGPLAAVTPGTPGGLMVMVAEYGRLSLKEVLAPAISMADGYAIETQAADAIEREKARIKQWPYSRKVFLVHEAGAAGAEPAAAVETGQGPTPAHDRTAPALSRSSRREGPEPGEIFRQPDLAATLRKLVETEQEALKHGKNRREAIYAAYDRFYKGDIAKELVRGVQEQGGLFTTDDLARWQVKIEEPVTTSYRGIDVYKLDVWTQGPAMLQALNSLENFDVKSMGYDSSRYINTIYQAMSLAFADRDFYYGDIYYPPVEPVHGLLSKAYAKERAALINADRNDPNIGPGDPYKYQEPAAANPWTDLLGRWRSTANVPRPAGAASSGGMASLRTNAIPRRDALPADTDGYLETFYAG